MCFRSKEWKSKEDLVSLWYLLCRIIFLVDVLKIIYNSHIYIYVEREREYWIQFSFLLILLQFLEWLFFRIVVGSSFFWLIHLEFLFCFCCYCFSTNSYLNRKWTRRRKNIESINEKKYIVFIDFHSNILYSYINGKNKQKFRNTTHTHTHSLTHIDTLAIDVSVETRIEFKETNSFLNIYTHTHAHTHISVKVWSTRN